MRPGLRRNFSGDTPIGGSHFGYCSQPVDASAIAVRIAGNASAKLKIKPPEAEVDRLIYRRCAV